jgi:hypothetical protein
MGFWVLPAVAEKAYLSGFLYWRLRTVATRCVLGGVSSGVNAPVVKPSFVALLGVEEMSAPRISVTAMEVT